MKDDVKPKTFITLKEFLLTVGRGRKWFYSQRQLGLTPRETRVGMGRVLFAVEAVAEWRKAMEDHDSAEADALRDWHHRRCNPVGEYAVGLAKRLERRSKMLAVAGAAGRSEVAGAR